jgi:hypothetical protein
VRGRIRLPLVEVVGRADFEHRRGRRWLRRLLLLLFDVFGSLERSLSTHVAASHHSAHARRRRTDHTREVIFGK